MAAQAAPKPRRRIVPILLASPVEKATEADSGGTQDAVEAPQQQLQADAQRSLSQWAREHLGPDRKIFLDLTSDGNKEVDWRQTLKERGVQKPSKAAKQAENGTGDDPLLLRGRTGRQENTWTRMLAKLEATYCVGALSDPDEDEEEGEEEGSDDGSDSEEDGEEGKGEGSGGEGGGGGGGGGGEGGGEARADKASRKRKEDGYDYMDEFIDDEEFIEFVHHDKRKPKHSGFFISKGEIERTDEMLPGFEELEREAGKRGGGKRKADDDAAAPAADGKEPRGPAEPKKRKQQEGEAGEGGKPAKKKKRVAPEPLGGGAAAPLSIAEQARVAGQMAAAGVTGPASAAPSGGSGPAPQRSGSQPPQSAKKRAPYDPPAAVLAAIAGIRAVAEQQPAPPPAGGEGEEGKRARRVLPKALKAALAEFSPLYVQQADAHGPAASNRLQRELAFLERFMSRQSLGQHLRGLGKERKAKDAKPVTVDELRQLIASKVKPAQVGSDDDFVAASSVSPQGPGEAGATQAAAPEPLWKRLDTGVQQAVYGHLKHRLEGAPVHSPGGQLLVQEVYNFFPPDTIGLRDLALMYSALLKREQKRQERERAAKLLAGGAAPAPGPQAAALPLAAQPNGTVPAAAPGVAAAAAAAGAAAAVASPAPAPAQLPSPQQVQPAPAEASQAAQPPAAAGQAAAAPLQHQPSEAEMFAALAVAAATTKLASPPNHGAAVGQQAQSAAASHPPPAVQHAVSAAAEAAAQAALAEAAAGAAGAPTQAPPQPPAPVSTCSDEQCVATAVAFGADEAALREVLASSRSSKYTYAYCRALMLAGPEGLTTSQVAQKAVELGWASWDTDKARAQLSRATQKDYVAYVAGRRNALRLFPGIVEVERPKRAAKQPGSAAPSGAAGDSPTESGVVEAASAVAADAAT